METTGPNDEVSAQSELRADSFGLETSDSARIENRLVLVAAATLVAFAALGAALAPYLLLHHPLVLIGLAPWPRHMILAAPHVGMLAFVAVGTLRAFASCAVGFALGARFGALRATAFQQRSKRAASIFTWFMRAFARAGHLLLLLFPGPLTGGVAAISGMRARVALPIMLVGQTAWVYVSYSVGHALQAWTQPIVDFVRAYMWQATLVCTLLAALYAWNRRRRVRAKARALSR